MTYRDDLEAASERAAALERELAEAKAENDRLKESVASAAPERAAREALSKANRDREDYAARQQAVREVKTASRPRLNRRWLRMATSRFGFVRHGDFYRGLPFIILLPSVAITFQLGDKKMPWIVLCNLGIAVAVIVVGLIVTAGSGARALAWLADLPFPTSGFEECFDDNPTRHGRITVLLSYQASVPEIFALRRFVGRGVEVDDLGNTLRVLVSTSRSELGSNREQYRVMRSLVEGVLVPLHRDYPLTSVRFQVRD